MDVVPSLKVQAEGVRASNDIELQTPLEICVVLNIQPMAIEEGEEIYIQLLGIIAKTPKVVDQCNQLMLDFV